LKNRTLKKGNLKIVERLIKKGNGTGGSEREKGGKRRQF
jgi:hypothetical protein